MTLKMTLSTNVSEKRQVDTSRGHLTRPSEWRFKSRADRMLVLTVAFVSCVACADNLPRERAAKTESLWTPSCCSSDKGVQHYSGGDADLAFSGVSSNLGGVAEELVSHFAAAGWQQSKPRPESPQPPFTWIIEPYHFVADPAVPPEPGKTGYWLGEWYRGKDEEIIYRVKAGWSDTDPKTLNFIGYAVYRSR